MIHKMSVHHLSDLLHECTQYPYAYRTHPMKAETTSSIYPANLKAIIALIFFCFLSSIKGRKGSLVAVSKPPRKLAVGRWGYPMGRGVSHTPS